jgi:hypothetical protein
MLLLPNAGYLNVHLWVTSSRMNLIIIKIRVAVFELRFADGETHDVRLSNVLFLRSTKTTVIIRAGDETVAIYRFVAMTFNVTKFAQN